MHRRDKAQSILNPAPPDNLLHLRRDVHHLIPLVSMEGQILGVSLHRCHKLTSFLKCYRMQECITLRLAQDRKKNPSTKASTPLIESSNPRDEEEMKKALHRFASLLCLLTLLLNAAACLH